VDCRHRQIMECPTCGRAWCVPAVVGPAVVFHNHCGSKLDLVLSPEQTGACTRGTVRFFRESNRLEVQPDVEGP